MESKIRKTQFVLMICTEPYLKRVMGQETTGQGLGIRWEGHLVYQHIYNAVTSNTKFVPVIYERNDKAFIPPPVQGSTYYSVSDPDDYERLYARLTGQARTVKPPLGVLRSLPPLAVKTDLSAGLVGEVGDATLPIAEWEGVTVESVYYAWRGPHEALVDRQPLPEPHGLVNALRTAGKTPHWTRPDNLASSFARGSQQVFQTDRRTYRREIRSRNLVLTVRSTA